MTFDLVIRGGDIVDGHSIRRADLGVLDGLVAAVGVDLTGGRTEIDATSHYVLPGGVDVHTHLDQVSAKGSRTADDFYSGSVSAAFGGTTTVMAFAAQARGTSIADTVARGLDSAARSAIDVGVHLIITDFTHSAALADLKAAADAGIATVKVFLTYEKLRLADSALLTVLAAARDLGMQVMVHAEHHGMISWTTGTLLADGRRAPANHSLAHSRQAEAAGVAEIASLAQYLDMTIYLVHLSSAEALTALRAARARGISLVAETCPHYLFLDETRLDAELQLAVQSMCSPPLRAQADRDALWSAVQAGDIDVIASDHAPYRLDSAKLPNGAQTTFTECANGIAGVEVRMPLMVSEALTSGRVSLSDVVRLCCESPARAMNVWPAKGSLQVGSDADIVLWDPTDRWTVTIGDLHDAMDHTAYEGIDLQGRITTVIVGGSVIVRNGSGDLSSGAGRFLQRDVRSRTVAGRLTSPVGGRR